MANHESKKREVAEKMIMHTHYDRAAGKLVRTMVPESKEHKKQVKDIEHHFRKANKTIGKFTHSDKGPKGYTQFGSRGFHE